ncbi:YciK family oxidoreductase [Aliidiomarina sanyensis]|uniref:YciK family oxidoreductase n=1 Tax=Aliidiomarina sanyensis TaxID=1249555 RepID=A0A432WDU6_9GAMM|nr:YciK family oxidoreductase [Aliidiomarina sanyensis]RUO30538.1 YciK family oxidoreductase [Aliidiomarina sanyensis]
MQDYQNYQAPEGALQGKVILVTGAGDGIGREAALTYARLGATVILLGRTTKKLEAVYDEIIEAGYPEPAIIPLDMKGATESHYRDMAATIEDQFGKLDGLLHNASILGVLSPFTHIDLPTWNDVLHVNVTAQFMMTKALIPVMLKAPSPRIIFTSSGVGRTGRAHWGPYAVSKFATEGMAQIIADEYENTSLRVNVINPGATRTAMRARAYPAEDSGKLKTAAEIMPVYIFLMSDAAAGITGESLDAQTR